MATLKGRTVFPRNLKDPRDWVNQLLNLGSWGCSFVLIKGKWPSNLWTGSRELQESIGQPFTHSHSHSHSHSYTHFHSHHHFHFSPSRSLTLSWITTTLTNQHAKDSRGVQTKYYRKWGGCRVNLPLYRQDGRLPRMSTLWLSHSKLMYQIRRPSYQHSCSDVNHYPQTADLNFIPRFLPLHPLRPSNRGITSINKQNQEGIILRLHSGRD